MPTFYGTARLEAAIVEVWRASILEAAFKAYWNESQKGRYPVLHDQEAGPQQPWPYCVYLLPASVPTVRMAGKKQEVDAIREIRDTKIEFHVFARSTGSTSGKELAAALAAQVREVFGGSPTVAPTAVPGAFLCQPGDELGVRQGPDEYKWLVKYTIRTDLKQLTG